MRTDTHYSLRDAPISIEVNDLGHEVMIENDANNNYMYITLDGKKVYFLVEETSEVGSLRVSPFVIEHNPNVNVMYLLSNHPSTDIVYFAMRAHGYEVPIIKHAYTVPDWYEIEFAEA